MIPEVSVCVNNKFRKTRNLFLDSCDNFVYHVI
nr:MAG TPA: hypothetical protein [Caudoviricetes sp.]